MKAGEENNLGSMQNYKTVRGLNDMIVVRLTTLARTSSPPLLCRRWMRDQSMGMLASPLVTQEREVRHHSEFITLIEKSSVTRSSHVGTSTERLVVQELSLFRNRMDSL